MGSNKGEELCAAETAGMQGFGGIQEHCKFEGTALVQGTDVAPSQWLQFGTRGQ